MRRIFFSLYLVLILLFGQLVQPDSGLCQRVFRLALMMDGDQVPNIRGRDTIMAALNDPSFQQSLGLEGRYVWGENAMFSIEPTTENQERIEAAARELMQRKDIDLIVSFCTVATGSLLRHNNMKTPVFLSSRDDLVEAGVVSSYDSKKAPNFHFDSGYQFTQDNLTKLASYFQFQSIGFIYEDTRSGKSRANFDEIVSRSKSLGWHVVAEPMKDESDMSCREAIQRLAEKSPDVFFMGGQRCLNGKNLSKLLQPLMKKRVPTLGEDEDQVRHGALASFCSPSDLRAREDARMIASILSGKPKASDLRITVNLMLNIAVAVKLGYNPSYALLATAEKLYWEIEGEKQDGRKGE